MIVGPNGDHIYKQKGSTIEQSSGHLNHLNLGRTNGQIPICITYIGIL